MLNYGEIMNGPHITKLDIKIHNKHFDQITLYDFQEEFPASGSSMFGKRTKDSDYDFLIHPVFNVKMWEVTRALNAEREQYYDPDIYSYSFLERDGLKINLIFFRDEKLYKAWKFATNNMHRLYHHGNYKMKKAINVKKHRCMLFQTFVKLHLEL